MAPTSELPSRLAVHNYLLDSARNMGFEPEGMTDAQMQELSDVFGLPK